MQENLENVAVQDSGFGVNFQNFKKYILKKIVSLEKYQLINDIVLQQKRELSQKERRVDFLHFGK